MFCNEEEMVLEEISFGHVHILIFQVLLINGKKLDPKNITNYINTPIIKKMEETTNVYRKNILKIIFQTKKK